MPISPKTVMHLRSFGHDIYRMSEKGLYRAKDHDIVSKHKFLGRDGHVNVTSSAGIASFPADGQEALELLNKADDAMYKSKMAGKNCATAWTEESAA